MIQERNGSDNPTVSYTRGTDLSGTLEGAGGIGGLLGRSHGYSAGNWSTHNFYHADGNGNVTYLVNSSQTLAAKYRYDPYGNTISSSGSLAAANTYRFSSKEIHVNSGLYYYGYRFYDPNTQTWLNRDPIGDMAFNLEKRMSLLSKLGVLPTDPEANAMWGVVQSHTLLADGPNGFLSMRNDMINKKDKLGLTPCTDFCDDDYYKKFHDCTGYAETACKIGGAGGAVVGGALGAIRGGSKGAVGGAVVVGGVNGGGWYVLVKAGCRYKTIIARGACYAGCMSEGDW